MGGGGEGGWILRRVEDRTTECLHRNIRFTTSLLQLQISKIIFIDPQMAVIF